jgi:hypothetical protein
VRTPLRPWTALSNPQRYAGIMRFKNLDWIRPMEEQLVASFGDARLVRQLDGKMELKGGTPEDHTAAKEWISLFMHEAVPRVAGRSIPERLGCGTAVSVPDRTMPSRPGDSPRARSRG